MSQPFPPPIDTSPIWAAAWWFIKLSSPVWGTILAVLLLTGLVKRRRR